jgi:sec-independent protein translocase protein TatA
MELSPGKIILILFIAFLLFGAKKLPEFGRATGHALREFKNATKGIMGDDEPNDKKDNTPTPHQ